MREILFRGKQTDNMKWVVDNSVLFFKNSTKIYGALNEWREVEVIPETIGQYTGLTDKNGTKIFEGDIVNYTQNYELSGNVVMVGTVKWSECYAGLCVTNFTNGLADRFLTNAQYRIEVIGNIYDNPELLRRDTE